MGEFVGLIFTQPEPSRKGLLVLLGMIGGWEVEFTIGVHDCELLSV